MGKIASVIQFTGRTGNVVGVKGQDGDIYLRVHRKHINDKKSQEQIANRAKLALAGCLSKLIPAELLAGMSGSGKRGRRQRWQKIIIKKMTTTTNDGIVTASLAPTDLIFSEGGAIPGINISDVTVADGKVSMSVTLPNGYTKVLVVAVFADSRTGGFSAVDSKMATDTGALEIPLPDTSFSVANIYTIPIVLTNSAAGVNYGNEVNAEGLSVSAYATTAALYDSERSSWMHSAFIGSYSA